MADPKTREEVIAITNRVAGEWGIPPALLLACGIAESNLRWNARRPVDPDQDAGYWPDVSGGVWQQTVRYDPEYQGGNAYPGPSETERILQRQYDVERSAHVAAENLKRKFRGSPNSDADILRALYQYNWPAGGGRPHSPGHEANYTRGLAEARAILRGVATAPAPPPFIADARIDLQPNDWSCALQATQWLLRSIGRNPDASDPVGDPWLTSQLVPSVIRPDVGLLKATGEDLAAWLNREYGSEMGFTAHYAPVTFDDVLAGAGVNPTIVGGRNYGNGGHWVGIRGVQDGALWLANSAPDYTNTGPTLDRAEWDARGPWSAVWIDRASALPGPTPEPPAPPAPDTRRERALEYVRKALATLEEAYP